MAARLGASAAPWLGGCPAFDLKVVALVCNRVQNYDTIEQLLAKLRRDVPANPFLNAQRACKYIWAMDGELGRLVSSMASPFWSPYLYRGQSRRYAACVPAVFRGLPSVSHPQKLSRLDRARCFLALVRFEEFLLAMAQHPATKFATEIGLVMSAEAIAQHYEIATDRIDLSEDPEIAAFFATQKRDKAGRWRPIQGGKGVIYRTNISQLRASLQISSDLECIGKQTLPRPGQQKAWTLRLPLGRDFEDFPVEAFTFRQSASCNRRIGALFEGGSRLFPRDGVATVAARIRTSKSVPRSLVGKLLIQQGCYTRLLERELLGAGRYLANHFKVSVLDRKPVTFSRAQLKVAENFVRRVKDDFLDDVGVRCVRESTS
jgi:hypothetical protein